MTFNYSLAWKHAQWLRVNYILKVSLNIGSMGQCGSKLVWRWHDVSQSSRFDCLPWIPAPALENDCWRWSASARARRAILSENFWDLSTLRFFKRWAAERVFAGARRVQMGWKDIYLMIYIYMHEWVETQRKHWKNELDFSSLERHFSWFFYLGGNLWLACWSTYFCGHRMMRYGWQDWWPSFRPRPSRYRLRIRRLDGKKLGHAAWMRLQPGVQNGCIVVVGGWIHFCTGMRPWNAADPFTNSFVGHGLSLSWFPPQW